MTAKNNPGQTARRRALRLGVAGIVGIAVIALVLLVTGPQDVAPERGDRIVSLLGEADEGDYAAVVPGRTFVFPDDHAAHPDYRQEWWYFTGNLATDTGRRFGFQLTFFRFAAPAADAYAASSWHHDQVWMAHFAVSDVAPRRFVAFDDYARGALDLAGARVDPLAIWVNGWSARGSAGAAGLDARLVAAADGAAIDIAVHTSAAPLLQGDAGYSVKDAAGRSASYYYSYPDLSARGTITLDGEIFDVAGSAWMDREWSTAVLAEGRTGWDWFALRLDGGARLMVFQVRGEDGDHFRHAVLVEANGTTRRFASDAVRLAPSAYWSNVAGEARYPLAWRIGIDSADIDLEVRAAFRDQELDLDFRYWEGVVDVAGRVRGRDAAGEGYMELTGYGGSTTTR